MSVGNLKDQGNKGNNFPYQLKTLQLLSAINQGISNVPANPVYGSTSAIVDTTPTTVINAPGAGLTTYVTQLLVTNSHATVGTLVTIQDGAANIIYTGYAAALGGFSVSFPTALKMPFADSDLVAVCDTNGASVYVSANGFIL